MARELAVKIVGDSSSLERAFARSERSAKRFNRGIESSSKRATSAFRGVAGGLAIATGGLLTAAGISAGVKKAVDSASSLNEEISKTSVIFPQSQQAIIAWAETTANAFGIPEREALAAASSIGGLFKTIGQGEQAAAGMSRQFVELAGDLASFFNVSTSDALDKLRSGLAGEAEPLRRFNVFIDEATVKAEAYRSGIAKTGSVLTQAQKLQARWNIILRETAPAQGDAARTADSWANVQRRLGALFDDMAGKLGQSLLPLLEKYGGQLADWLAKAENQQRVVDAFEEVAGVLEDIGPVVSYLVDEWKQFTDILGKVAELTRKFVLSFKITGLQAAAAFVEPFSHLPGRFGDWARDAKDSIQEKLIGAKAEWRDIGTESGSAIYEGMQMGLKGATGKRTPKPKIPQLTTGGGKTAPVPKPISAAMRNQWFDARIARQLDRLQDMSLRKQLARLREIAAAIRSRLAATKDITRRLTLEDKLLEVARQQKQVQAEITAKIQEGNQALKDRADAIKSAVIERLQRRQTNILNRRALDEAKEQLRIARLTGGPVGLRQARQAVADAQAAIQLARVEGAVPRLTRGGQFALAGVVINIHGVTDAEAVANRVAAVLQRRRRRTARQSRGNKAGV